ALQLVGNSLEAEGFMLSENFYTEANSCRFLRELAAAGILHQASQRDRLLHLFLNEYIDR
ncbi:MAG: hypothetical protein F6K03_02665, partial [Kamptonema sp. SIO4C4]|nr:hypothetical protein [Kamptonema sp. SIO4C4]